MALTTTVTTSANSGGSLFSDLNTLSGSGRTNINEAVPGSSADLKIDCGVPNSTDQVKFFAIQSFAGGTTVELWDSLDTIIDASATYTLAAGETFIWPATTGEPAPAWVGVGDIAKLAVTSADTTAAQVIVSFLYDSTTP